MFGSILSRDETFLDVSQLPEADALMEPGPSRQHWSVRFQRSAEAD
jgi:hypothetical protein